MTELTSNRIILREWRDEDLAPFAALNVDPKVMEYFPAPLSRAESDAMVARIRSLFDDFGYGLWALEIPGVTAFAGMVGLNQVRFDAPFTPAVEVGWRLAHAYWGKGYASEAAQLSLTYGFETLQLPEIVSLTATSNHRSQAVMQRIGMTRNANDDFDHPKLAPGHPLQRHVLYRKQRS
ncbi:GNAT family N-acetyltransferase [Glaciimonas soli]|uniref:GNAT family N-acetyltransferase n=1 Tax=Glaciimonas soli TaxID=2590999 RepID=A0A843YJI1_9BURK|nr:GNAT family N-acetyltransferase [Glaciimonas soli]MQQ99534.1 GNAT family N-acetyltransferase [Glaciimonas soli]